MKTTICITHSTLHVTCIWEYVYIYTWDLLYSLRIKWEILSHQEPDTCYDQIRYYELSKRNNLAWKYWIRTKPTRYTLRATDNLWIWSLKSRKQPSHKRQIASWNSPLTTKLYFIWASVSVYQAMMADLTCMYVYINQFI